MVVNIICDNCGSEGVYQPKQTWTYEDTKGQFVVPDRACQSCGKVTGRRRSKKAKFVLTHIYV
jgi:uncharacterized Zn finger protein